MRTGAEVGHQTPSPNRIDRFDEFSAVIVEKPFARWVNRAIVFFLILFSLSVPHSIAAAQISLGLGLIAWAVRDFALKTPRLARSPIDWPLFFFALLTVVSSAFSIEPSVSMPKLKSLILFGVIYLVATNLSRRGAQLMVFVVIASSLVGVGFSLMEKLWGRGMTITSIAADSPLAGSKLQAGDVIWMIARQRVFTLEKAAYVIRQHRAGEVLEIEALHAGDPIPVTLTVTDELKARPNPLGINVDGRSRRFRASGFSRQFQTYAEQMQILAMLAYGGLLTSLKFRRRQNLGIWLKIFGLLFILFALALALTASRAVIASFIIAVLLVSIGIGSRLAPIIALIIALGLGAIGFYVVSTSRQQATLSFEDDSSARRMAYMQAGLRLIPKRPLIGVGMDSYQRHWREWGFPGAYVTHTHSTPIQIAMERGLLALICYFWLMATMTVMAWRNYRRAKMRSEDFGESLTLGAFGALIGFSISSLANYNFGDSEVLMMLLLTVGLVIAYARNRPEKAMTKS
jgi:hypothetical protein